MKTLCKLLFVAGVALSAELHGTGFKPMLTPKRNGRTAPATRATPSGSYDARNDPRFQNCRAVTEVLNQLDCGVCFSFSTATVLGARICGETGHNVSISSQQAADCTVGSCAAGGSATEVFAYWTGLDKETLASAHYIPVNFERGAGAVTRGCRPYKETANKNECIDTIANPVCENGDDIDNRYFVDPDTIVSAAVPLTEADKNTLDSNNYQTLSMDELLVELEINGPVSVGFMTYVDINTFKGTGIYRRSANARQYGGHAVTLIGYGYDTNNELYFIIQNSWGPTWGDNGYAKMYASEFYNAWMTDGTDDISFINVEYASPVSEVDFSEYDDSFIPSPDDEKEEDPVVPGPGGNDDELNSNDDPSSGIDPASTLKVAFVAVMAAVLFALF